MYLEAKDLSVGYGGEPLLQNLIFGVEKGTILCLIGPSGAGKSAVIRTLAGQIPPLSGIAAAGGEDLFAMNRRTAAKKIALVLPDAAYPAMMTCMEVVLTGRYAHIGAFGVGKEIDRQAAAKAMELTGVDSLAEALYSQLTRDEALFVLLARAIAQTPELILLDDPDAGLSLQGKAKLLQILRRAALKLGIAIVLSAKDPGFAAKAGDQIMVVKGGRMVALGAPEDIVNDDSICELYQMPAGSFSVNRGGYELLPAEGYAKIFILGGDGAGTPLYRALTKRGYAFSTGILHENDLDYAVAKTLAARLLWEESFCKITRKNCQEAREEVLRCGVFIDSGVPFAEFNAANLELLRLAQDEHKPILSMREGIFGITEGTQVFRQVEELVNSPVLHAV